MSCSKSRDCGGEDLTPLTSYNPWLFLAGLLDPLKVPITPSLRERNQHLAGVGV